jgi:hypothetical protein
MNFATIQPKLSQYCLIAVKKGKGAQLFRGRQSAAAVTASLLVAGAFFVFLFSVVNAHAQGPFGTCEDAAELAILPSPIAPWKGAPLRVVFAAEKPLEGEFSLIAPDGSVAAKSRARHGGPPYFWFAEVASPAAGTWHATLVRARDLHYLFGLTAGQPTLLQDAKHWLGSRKAAEADAVSEDFERGNRVVRRLFIGPATAPYDGWEHLRTVLRIQTETFEGTAEPRVDERYLISSMPTVRLTADHWLLVARRHWGVETSHQILDTAFEEDDHPWIETLRNTRRGEACPRAALVVAILRRIAYTMLALFRSVTQRSDERRATPWQTLMTDLFVALISTTDLELRDPKPLRMR